MFFWFLVCTNSKLAFLFLDLSTAKKKRGGGMILSHLKLHPSEMLQHHETDYANCL